MPRPDEQFPKVYTSCSVAGSPVIARGGAVGCPSFQRHESKNQPQAPPLSWGLYVGEQYRNEMPDQEEKRWLDAVIASQEGIVVLEI